MTEIYRQIDPIELTKLILEGKDNNLFYENLSDNFGLNHISDYAHSTDVVKILRNERWFVLETTGKDI